MQVLPVADPPLPAPADASPAAVPGTCASCGAALTGPYCHRCGEKRLDRHDYAFGHWLEHTVDAFTHFDLKVPRGLWSLLRRPGVMTADVLAGRRVRWPKPFQAFLIANVLYYAVASALHFGTFETPLRFHQSGFYGATVQAWSAANAADLGVSMAEYAERFDALAHALSKTLIVFFVPVFAATFGLLHVGRQRYALEHVTAGVHFTTLLLLLLPLPLPLVVGAMQVGLVEGGDGLWTIASSVLIGAYAAAFCRRVYGDTRLVAALKATAVPAVFYAALILLYRPLLFALITALL